MSPKSSKCFVAAMATPMESPEACEIARLPEELLSAAIALTTPRDACRAATVSRAFRAAADSDAVWACFLPSDRDDLPPLPDDGELPPRRKKDLYLRLTGSPVLVDDDGEILSMWLDRDTAGKCYMVSARELAISTWGDEPQYWSWIPLADSRFSDSAIFKDGCYRLEISGRMHLDMLSQGPGDYDSAGYAAYLVYKLDDDSYGLGSQAQEGWIGGDVGGGDYYSRQVCLHVDHVHDDGPEEGEGEEVELPRRRADGWVELKLGVFTFDLDIHEDVSFGLEEMGDSTWKRGLILQGIEIRPVHKK